MLEPPGRRIHLKSKIRIVNYMRQNFDSWLEFANGPNGPGLGLKQEDIIFVSGTIKTTRWVTAAFHGSYKHKAGAISCGVTNVGKLSFSLSFSNELSGHKFIKYGPSGPRTSSESADIVPHLASSSSAQELPKLEPTQSLFFHYYKMKKRFLWRSKPMEAAAGPHELPPGDDNQGEGPVAASQPSSDEPDFEENPPAVMVSTAVHLPCMLTDNLLSQVYDPVEVLLEWILEVRFGISRLMIPYSRLGRSIQSQLLPLHLTETFWPCSLYVVSLCDRPHSDRFLSDDRYPGRCARGA